MKLLLILLLLPAVLLMLLSWAVLTDRFPPMPALPNVPEKWFGKGQRVKDDETVKPFKINIDEKVLSDLKKRIDLDLARLAPPLEDAAFTYGFNSDTLRQVAQHWQGKYDWRKEEKVLNSFPQFTTSIDGLDIHFLHVKPTDAKGKKVLPLLMVHGWPGSFVEFKKLIPLLTTPQPGKDFVFEVIVPSIPGYGFSSAPAKMGFNGAQCARVFRRLMTERLGFDTFYTQGGDWGSLITSSLATLYPASVRGAHFNMVMANSPSVTLKQMLSGILPAGWVVAAEELHKLLPLGEKFSDLVLESGYMHIQSTKPDTVGVAMGSSPLGLAAYIMEKFSTWTSKANRKAADGNLTGKFTMDELLTNVMIYWVTGSITSSVRFYAENMAFKPEDMAIWRIPIETVPIGIANFPEEIALQPRSLVASKYKNILTFTEMARGGHFAAFEEPKLLADDIWQFFAKAQETASSKGGHSEL